MQNVDLNGKTVLITGAAGFIGSNLCKRLLGTVEDVRVIGIDSMNDYYTFLNLEITIKDSFG